MKHFIKIIVFLLLFMVPFNVLAVSFKLDSEKVLLVNLNDDSFLYEKNIDEKTYIASLTKIMTAIVVLENVQDLNSKGKIIYADVKDFAYDVQLSGLKLNTNYSYMDLLHGLLLSSGGDCANALARLTFGSVNNFVNEMNKKAKELGMTNTHFANTTGLDDKKNYSTARDIYILFKYALNNEVFNKIVRTLSYNASGVLLEHTIDYYFDKFDISMPYLIGGKTGNDVKAGYCLASIASYNDVNYMLITLNASNVPNHFVDSKKIYEYYMNNYGYQVIISSNDILKELDTKYLKEEKIYLKSNKYYSYYLENDYEKDIKTEYVGYEVIDNSFEKGDYIGSLFIYYDGEVLDEIKLYLEDDIHFDIFKYLKGNVGVVILVLCVLFLIIFVFVFIRKMVIKIK